MSDPTKPIITPAQVKTEVKTEVKKELSKRDFSWIRRDWVVIGAFFILLAVLSTVQTISLNRIEETVKNSDVLAECFTPGTRCSDFAAQNRQKEQTFIRESLEAASLCIILAGRETPGIIDREVLKSVYNRCILGEAPPTTTTTTPRR